MSNAAVAWTRFGQALKTFVGKRVRLPEDADEIVQEIMLRAHTSLGEVPDDRLAAWLYRVARNAIVDHYRRKAARPAAADLPEDLPDLTEDPDPMAAMATCMRPLLDELPQGYAEAVRLADLDGLPQRAVAERLGIGLSGAKSRVQRGRVMLREALERCCRVETDGRGKVVDCRRSGPGPDCEVP